MFVIRVVRTVAIASALSLLIGCGARRTATPDVRAPISSDRDGDRDGDGIPDADDNAPDTPGTLSTPGKNKARFADAPQEAQGQGQGQGQKQQTQTESESQQQRIVYSARVSLAVFQVEQGLAAVESLARNMGGYLAQKHDREITIRVPRTRFQPTLVAIDKIGDVTHRDIQAEDVSDDYVDVEIRITNARAMQTRLRLLLEHAAVKEALDIEKELARVTQELELYEGKMKVLKDKIAYSTITVAFETRGVSIQTRTRLPFVWLSQLGLPTLLTLEEGK